MATPTTSVDMNPNLWSLLVDIYAQFQETDRQNLSLMMANFVHTLQNPDLTVFDRWSSIVKINQRMHYPLAELKGLNRRLTRALSQLSDEDPFNISLEITLALSMKKLSTRLDLLLTGYQTSGKQFWMENGLFQSLSWIAYHLAGEEGLKEALKKQDLIQIRRELQSLKGHSNVRIHGAASLGLIKLI